MLVLFAEQYHFDGILLLYFSSIMSQKKRDSYKNRITPL